MHVVEPGFHATNLIDPEKMKQFSKASWERLPAHLKEEYPEDYVVQGKYRSIQMSFQEIPTLTTFPFSVQLTNLQTK